MTQWLVRGHEIDPGVRIRRLVSSSEHWQIYETSGQRYVLVIDNYLESCWEQESPIVTDLFSKMTELDRFMFCGKHDALISSMLYGPYPTNDSQIEAFSIVLGNELQKTPDLVLGKCLYLEEYSLLLEDSTLEQELSNNVALGKWLTGGVEVGIESIERIHELTAWLPYNSLLNALERSGLLVKETITAVKTTNMNQGSNPSQIPDEPFSLPGRPELEQFFNEEIISILRNPEAYKRMGVGFPGATILFGPPGCGKTFAVDRLSEYLNWPRYDIDSNSIGSPFIHDTSKKISEVFQSAIENAPSILVIDEMEAYLSNREQSGSTSGHHIEEVGEFLRKIPNAVSSGVVIIAMTNMLDSIDPAILRRGRFDHIVEVKMAGEEEIKALLISATKDLPIDESVDFSQIAKELSGHPLSDVSYVLRESGKQAIRTNSEYITSKCFDYAIGKLPKKQEKRRIGFY